MNRKLNHWVSNRPTRRQALSFGAALGLAGWAWTRGAARAIAQDNESPPNATDPAHVSFSDPQTFVWDMGVEIGSGGGQARGLNASFPVPIDWPEQTVQILEETHAPDVKVTLREMDGQAKVATVRIPQLQAGDSERVVIRVKVEKRWIEAPTDPSSLVVPERLAAEDRGYLQPSPYIESDDRVIRELVREVDDPALGAWQRVERIFDWVRANLAYEFDEQIHSCRHALEAEKGDCEELSSVFIALCRASGIPARAVWIPGHTYPEFMLQDASGAKHWYPCQAAGAARDFGRMPEWKPILQKGDKFRVPSQRQPQRYLAPTLSASDAQAAPTLKWILEQVIEPPAQSRS